MVQWRPPSNLLGGHEGCWGLRDVLHADRGDAHGRGHGHHAHEADAHPPRGMGTPSG